jgi:thiol-disulfide isomerase/thioredoxin
LKLQSLRDANRKAVVNVITSGFIFELAAVRVARPLAGGKVVIVNFWATWCAPYKAEMPALQSYLDRYKSEGLEILAISMDEPRDLPAVEKVAQSYTFQLALKSDANFKVLGRIWRMPTTFVVDRDGILRKNGHVGDAEITLTELETLVAPLLAKP